MTGAVHQHQVYLPSQCPFPFDHLQLITSNWLPPMNHLQLTTSNWPCPIDHHHQSTTTTNQPPPINHLQLTTSNWQPPISLYHCLQTHYQTCGESASLTLLNYSFSVHLHTLSIIIFMCTSKFMEISAFKVHFLVDTIISSKLISQLQQL